MDLVEALTVATTLDGVVVSTSFGECAARIGGDGPVVMFTKAHERSQQISLKLSQSSDFARTLRGIRPMGHGLGKHGWVTIDLGIFSEGEDVLTEFVEESYDCAIRRRRR